MLFLVARSARADIGDLLPVFNGQDIQAFPVFHGALGLGGASENPHFRAGLDAAAGVGLSNSTSDITTINAGVVTGFGKWPTYLMLDAGRTFFASGGEFSALTGLILNAGPAFRVAPTTGFGGELSARIWVLYLQLGVRAIGIVTLGPEIQVEGIAGVGLL